MCFCVIRQEKWIYKEFGLKKGKDRSKGKSKKYDHWQQQWRAHVTLGTWLCHPRLPNTNRQQLWHDCATWSHRNSLFSQDHGVSVPPFKLNDVQRPNFGPWIRLNGEIFPKLKGLIIVNDNSHSRIRKGFFRRNTHGRGENSRERNLKINFCWRFLGGFLNHWSLGVSVNPSFISSPYYISSNF